MVQIIKWGEVCERLPFGRRHANRFITIAQNEALQNGTHVSRLPTDTATLYNLARLPAPELEQHIKAGSVHAGMYAMVYIPAPARVGLPW